MSTVPTPVNVRAYEGSANDTWYIMWTNPFVSSGDLSEYDYDVWVDSSADFNTINLKQYTKSNCLNFDEGSTHIKGMSIEVSPRQRDQELTYYTKVRVNGGGYLSDWSDTESFTIQKYYGQEITDNMHDAMADENAYSKESNSTNIYQLFRAYGKEMDATKIEYLRSKMDNYLAHVRDEDFYDKFGYLIGLKKTTTETYAEYREHCITILNAMLNYSSRKQGLIDVIQTYTAEAPIIYDLSSKHGWVLGATYLRDPARPQIQPTIYLLDSTMKGSECQIYIYNGWDFTLDHDKIEKYINLIKPIYAKAYIYYPAAISASTLYDLDADWAMGSYTDTEASDDSLVLSAGQNSGNWVSPVMDFSSTVNAWGILEADEDEDGGTITYQYRSSFDNSDWSAYETVSNYSAPVSTPIRRYVQVKVLFSRDDSSQVPIINSLCINYHTPVS